jgi:drug/metabolite transporter (DMT)-like permease
MGAWPLIPQVRLCPMRRALSLLLASALLLAGLALAVLEIGRPDEHSYVLFGAGAMFAAGVVWLLDELVLPRWRRKGG